MDFQQLLDGLSVNAEVFTVQDVTLTIVMSFVLALVVAQTYKVTYRGANYSQSYVHTLVLMSMVVAVIMLIIGSNIARAFTLVGALSIIRFRNAVKDTRDVGFIFFAMAVGMACGTRFYLIGVVATLVISALIWSMVRFNFFAQETARQLLKVRVPADMAYASLLAPLFDEYVRRYDLVAMETVQAGTLTELVYSIELKSPAAAQEFLNAIAARNDNNKVVLVTGQQEVDL
ncbi:MAG: DUF4956 domain-containing protein [Caldilineaceae bacterium]|nr:DUF4956 domain-containing protein [Caldilineaceae bacterium]MCB9160989.1 DUF4956 domain-containing protein [Caldilineaceae bacterium]